MRARSYSAKTRFYLHQHLFFGGLTKGVVEKDDLTPRPLEFLDDDDLLGIVPREPIRGRYQHRDVRSLRPPDRAADQGRADLTGRHCSRHR
jgi:hypothetical protein